MSVYKKNEADELIIDVEFPGFKPEENSLYHYVDESTGLMRLTPAGIAAKREAIGEMVEHMRDTRELPQQVIDFWEAVFDGRQDDALKITQRARLVVVDGGKKD